MSEEMKKDNVQENEDMSKKADVDAEIKEDENGNMKAEPKKTAGEKVKDFGKAAWGFTKKAIPIVGAFAAGAATMFGVATFVGSKEAGNNLPEVPTPEALPEKDDTANG